MPNAFGPHINPAGGTGGGAGGSFSAGVSTLGNTLGNTGTVSNQVVLAGGANVTLSQSTDAGGATVTVIGGAGAAAATAISGLANSQTTYTSGTVNLSVVGGNMTIRSTTGQAFQFSVSQSVQAETQTFVGGIGNSETTYTSGTVNLSGLGNVTVRSTTGQAFQISVPAQSVQAETQTFLGGVAGSNTTYTSGTVTITGVGGGVTVGSNTGQRIDISVAAPVAQTVQTQNMVAISATNTLYTSGTLTITGSNMVTVKSSAAGQAIIIDATQSVQTQNAVDVTLSGNTAGVMALVSSGTMTLAGGNNITLSQVGNAVTISGANAGGAQTAISGLANSETTYTSGSVTLSALANITIRSTTGQQFQFSVANPQTAISGLANSQTTYTSGTVSLSELGAITIRSTTGNQYQFSVNSQTNQSAIKALGASNTGNTAGNTGVSTGVDWVLAGSNNITISQSTAGGGPNTLWVSGPTVGGAQTGLSGVSNSQTTYTSGTFGFSELGAITIRSTTGQAFQFSVNSQTNQSAIKALGVSNTGNTLGNTGVSTGVDWVIGASGGITASESTAGGGPNTIWMSVANPVAQTNQSAIRAFGVSNTGTTAGNTGVSTGIDWVIAASGNVTASESTAGGGPNTVWISVPAQTTQVVQSAIAASNTTYTSGLVVFTGSNMITVKSSGAGQTVILDATQTNQSAIKGLGVSNTGNTAGNTGVSTGVDWVIAGSTNITASQSTAAGGPNTIWLSAAAGGGAGMSAGLSNIGNSSGDTVTVTGRLVLAGGNNITLSGSSNAGSMTITISAPNLGAGAMSAGMSNLGNTAGSSGITGTQMVLVGTGPISLSQSTGANGGTLSINAPATSSLVGSSGLSVSTAGSTITVYQAARSNWIHNSAALYSSSSSAISGTLVSVVRMEVPDVISFSRVDIPMSISLGTSGATNTAAHSISKVMNLYTRNGSTLNALTGTSQTETFSWASNTANFANLTGPRLMSFPLATYMTPGEYYIGYYISTVTFSTGANTTNLGGTYGVLFGTQASTATMWAQLQSATAQTSNPMQFMQGVQSISLSATSQTIQASNITQSGTAGIRPNQILIFRN